MVYVRSRHVCVCVWLQKEGYQQFAADFSLVDIGFTTNSVNVVFYTVRAHAILKLPPLLLPFIFLYCILAEFLRCFHCQVSVVGNSEAHEPVELPGVCHRPGPAEVLGCEQWRMLRA